MKMIVKCTRLILCAILSINGLTSCIYIHPDQPTSRGTESREYSLSPFNKIKVGDAIRLKVTAGASYSVKATGELNDLDDLEIFVNSSQELSIRYKNSWRTRERMDFTITMPALREVHLSGAATALLAGFDQQSELSIKLSGAAELTAGIEVNQLIIDLSGGSLLTIDGSGDMVSGNITGASECRAYDFTAHEANLNLSGGSLAWVNISNLLKVKGSGASTVRYKGTPTVQSDLSGGSRVDKFVP